MTHRRHGATRSSLRHAQETQGSTSVIIKKKLGHSLIIYSGYGSTLI